MVSEKGVQSGREVGRGIWGKRERWCVGWLKEKSVGALVGGEASGSSWSHASNATTPASLGRERTRSMARPSGSPFFLSQIQISPVVVPWYGDSGVLYAQVRDVL